MPRPFTPAQAHQNAAFLAALRRTGNTREAARQLGVHRSTMLKRRAKDAALAAEWDAALAVAHARLRSPSPSVEGLGEGHVRKRTTQGPHIIRTASGRLQLRRPGPRRLGPEAEQAFLAALSATANIRLSAAAAGFSHSAFYHRRKQSPAFAREMRMALKIGCDRVEFALLESFAPDSYADDAWRHNDPPAVPPMTASQALQLLYLHQKEARLLAEPDHIKRRRGESREAHSVRLSAMYRASEERSRLEFLVAEAARRESGRPWVFGPRDLPADLPKALPDLAIVTGWSKADPEKIVHHEGVALFGGWRLKDWEAKKKGG